MTPGSPKSQVLSSKYLSSIFKEFAEVDTDGEDNDGEAGDPGDSVRQLVMWSERNGELSRELSGEISVEMSREMSREVEELQ